MDKLFGNIAHIEHASRPLINSSLFTSVKDPNIFHPIPDPLGRRSFFLPRIKERPSISELPVDSIPTPIKFQMPILSNQKELQSAVSQLRAQVKILQSNE